jgi:FlaG/FlaF family flagellin (archaellin)
MNAGSGRIRGTSPAIGVAVLLVIVVLLAVLVWAFVLGFQVQAAGPQVATNPSLHSTYDADAASVHQYLDVAHEGGDPIDPEDLEVVVEAGKSRYRADDALASPSGTARAGDTISYNLSEMDLCGSNAESVEMTVIHEPSKLVIARSSVRIRRTVDLSVEGNRVTADAKFVASVTVLGLGASAGGAGDTIKPDVVNARVVLYTPSGREVLTPWPDDDPDDALGDPFAENVNYPGRPNAVTYSTGERPAGTSVTLELRASKPADWRPVGDGSATRTVDGTAYAVRDPDPDAGLADPRYWVDTTNPDDGTIILLEDGDAVPTYGTAATHQRSLRDMLQHRLGPSGTLDLDDNEVVALYELADADAEPADAPAPGTGGNPDYNDGVAIIEVEPIPGGDDASSDGGVVYCT